jgi:hypothetical protein
MSRSGTPCEWNGKSEEAARRIAKVAGTPKTERHTWFCEIELAAMLGHRVRDHSFGRATGLNRARVAAERAAIAMPSLPLAGAAAVLVAGGLDVPFTCRESYTAWKTIDRLLSKDAETMYGMYRSLDLGAALEVTLIGGFP